MIEKTITNKVKKIFEAMKWDLSQVIPVKPKKERKKKNKDTEVTTVANLKTADKVTSYYKE
jgi:hypothetical protein